ncbi:hypothetical protein GRS48_14780 [Halorubrum sp. JWXQ-INN 858]|uniref:DUF7283 family protein n=1 Tax=Halorubrum sp. JWXQ-INN 858 TaxID=2690782 RepID=UPI00135A5F77|nr:hypothetical protein [Halorubrum sp. JWXQ-INN 858]MWV66074.1 hypothetical protein [Halorubrum sp. JWXQ-INN 858]
MFDAPFDATYAWLGVALVSVATAGVAATLPASPPPDASGVAHTIDSVADGEYPATAEHGLSADRVRITTGTVSLRSDGGTARATLLAARTTPVAPPGRADGDLRRVLDGVPPDRVFADPDAFAAAATTARDGPHEWRAAPNRLTIRQVHYGDVRVTLVG